MFVCLARHPCVSLEAGKSSHHKIVNRAQREKLTVRELAQWIGGSFGTLELIGTPQTIADAMETWLETEACDGFDVMFPYLPEGLDECVIQMASDLR